MSENEAEMDEIQPKPKIRRLEPTETEKCLNYESSTIADTSIDLDVTDILLTADVCCVKISINFVVTFQIFSNFLDSAISQKYKT